MGLLDDLLSKATEFTGMSQDVADTASQATEEAQAQAQEHIENATGELPTDPQEEVNKILDGWNQDQQ